MHPDLVALCTDSIVHEAFASQDGYGAPTYSAPVIRPGRLEYKIRRIVDSTGEERLSRARVFFDGTFTLELRDRLTLPDGTAPRILQLYGPRDETGAVDHWEATF